MKKFLISVLGIMLSLNTVFALDEIQKTELESAKRIKKIKTKIIDEQISTVSEKYSDILFDESLSEDEKFKQISDIETKLIELDKQKAKIKQNYKRQKHKIKNKYKY